MQPRQLGQQSWKSYREGEMAGSFPATQEQLVR